MGEEPIASVAWLYKPLGSKVGVLQLDEGRLSFVLKDGKVVFDAPVHEVEIHGWPSYGVAPNSQVKLRVAGKKHRVCFVAPSNSREVINPMDPTGMELAARTLRALRTYPEGLKVGAVWHERLGD
jgi:hypothetical protein